MDAKMYQIIAILANVAMTADLSAVDKRMADMEAEFESRIADLERRLRETNPGTALYPIKRVPLLRRSASRSLVLRVWKRRRLRNVHYSFLDFLARYLRTWLLYGWKRLSRTGYLQ